MDQLHPTEQFPITYVLDDPNDTGTYYVRAVIYDDVAGTTIETVDLTDLGGGRFKKIWYVCPDVSGQGRYISIVTKVYTDPGYTTLADSYQQKENKYLVQERWNRGNLGGGVAFSYKRIEEIVDKALGKIPKTNIPKPKETDLQPIVDALIEVRNEVKAIEIPKPEKIDFSSVLDGLNKVKKAVESIYIPETDLSPVIAELERMKLENIREEISEMFKKIGRFFLDDVDEIKEVLNKLQKQIEEKAFIAFKPKDEEKTDI